MFSYIEINIISCAIILIIFFNIRNKKDRYLYDQKLFILLLFFNLLIIIVDTAMWVANMRTGETARYVNIISSLIYYMLNPVPCMLWSIYADFQIHKDEPRIKRISIPLGIPVAINAILALLSTRYGYLFYIDSSNTYHRGSFFIIMCIICYFYFMITFLKLLRYKNSLDKRQYTSLIFFGFPPFISAVFQILFYGISVIWVSMSFSLLIVFLNIQNNQLYIDYLTGVFNRRQLDNYLYQKIKSRIKTRYFAGIMIDINCFKQINDEFGHTAGDNALICVADILKMNFRKKDFIARYGGDEFIVVMEIKDKFELNKVIDTLRENIHDFNVNNNLPYEISLSIGYDIYKTKSGVSIEKFYKHIDKLMYEDKRKKAIS